MVKPGPKSALDLEVSASSIPGVREPVPADLEPAAKVIWEAIVIRLPADWFTTETVPILKAYCRHASYADTFAREIAAIRHAINTLEAAIHDSRAKKPTGIRQLAKLSKSLHELHKMHGYETDHATSCATRLRLTNQSRMASVTARSKSTKIAATGAPPWHTWGNTPATEN